MAMLLFKSHKPYLEPIDKVLDHESFGLGLACLFLNLASIDTLPVWQSSYLRVISHIWNQLTRFLVMSH